MVVPGALLDDDANDVPFRGNGTPHFHWAKSGDYVTQVTAIGPISLEYLDPEDDPRNKVSHFQVTRETARDTSQG